MIVRALVRDDPGQAETARALLAGEFLLTASVLVETEWVLRSSYKWPRETVALVLLELVDLPNMVAGSPGLRWAIERFASGADLADMIHVVTSETADRFVTFDRRLARDAGQDAPLPIETLA